MQRERAPLALEAAINKFGMYLAFKESRKGQLLDRHSVMQYFRQAKNWLLEQFPQHRAVVEKNLLKKGQTLEPDSLKHESGSFVIKYPACTESALNTVMEYSGSTTIIGADFQDAALLCMLWFIFGRTGHHNAAGG